MSLVTLGRAKFLRLCPCLYYNAVSGHVKPGLATPVRPVAAYNPDNLSSKNISSCEWICPQS